MAITFNYDNTIYILQNNLIYLLLIFKLFAMRLINIILFLGLSISTTNAQFVSAPVISPGESLRIDFDMDKGILYSHTIKANQTLFSIAKFFDISIQELLMFNGMDKDNVASIGQKILIPIPHQFLIKQVTADAKLFAPVIYKVKAKETLFRISRIYFDQPIVDLVERNKLGNLSLSIDDVLTVGYISLEGLNGQVSENLKKIREQRAISRLETPNIDESTGEPLNYIKNKRGIAIWDKDGSDQKNLFVLHKTAKVNSLIEIYNPVVKRKITARVIGKIPENLYSSDVSMVISPKVASTLGALDSRFMVEMNYYE